MLELKPVCENCNVTLLPNSKIAMICSYECTFCVNCVSNILDNVCPNCGGGFEKRPIRPQLKLTIDKASTVSNFKPTDLKKFELLKNQKKNILPSNR
jgi:hypothetical protein